MGTSDTGDDVLLRFVLGASPSQYLDQFDHLEPMMLQSFRMIYEPGLMARFLTHEKTTNQEEVLKKLIEWVTAFRGGDPTYKGRIGTAISIGERFYSSATDLSLRKLFYSKLFKAIPELRQELQKDGTRIRGVL